MRLVSAFALLAIAACGQPPATPAGATVPTAEQPASTSAARTRTKVEGWETDLTAFARLGSTLPAFALKQPDGTELTPVSYTHLDVYKRQNPPRAQRRKPDRS